MPRISRKQIAVIVAGGAITACALAWHGQPLRTRGVLSPRPRMAMDIGGFRDVIATLEPWRPTASLPEIAQTWRGAAQREIDRIDAELAASRFAPQERLGRLLGKTMMLHYAGKPREAYAVVAEARSQVEADRRLSAEWLYTLVYLQGVTALRCGETENCVMCRGESSCILPISPAAIHVNPQGSRQAIEHFSEYLAAFPDDLAVRWLLNLAHMTLGEHPHAVDPRFLVSLEQFRRTEFDVGKFRDVAHTVGVDRFNQAGGAIMDDFDGDGLLDLAITSIDPTQAMAIYRNRGEGRFVDSTAGAGVGDQLGGLNCVQIDFDNDGFLDIYIPRGAWLRMPMRPSLLRNNGDGTFDDVTERAHLLYPQNSNAATWADYDNDGLPDLFVCCEAQPILLFHNQGDSTFVEVSGTAGLQPPGYPICKGAAWIDIDNDDRADLFLDSLNGSGSLYQNTGRGTFRDVTEDFGVDGPQMGFSCWAWDYDNDGWLDIFATSYDRTLADVAKGLLGQPHDRHSNRLFRNVRGKRFEDVAAEAGLDLVFATMGSNFADFDNDGFLDMYLATGDPSIDTLVPNRMFKNVGGKRFAEVTAGSGTGHLQKGHGVACADWDRDGDVDLFVEVGGVVDGDKFHNVLFQNPGHGKSWLRLKLIGRESNRSAIGTRVKVVASGTTPLTVYRHVSSGSSFGANPLELMIGLNETESIETLEVHWPRSGTTQTFHDLAVNQALAVVEFSDTCVPLDHAPIDLPNQP